MRVEQRREGVGGVAQLLDLDALVMALLHRQGGEVFLGVELGQALVQRIGRELGDRPLAQLAQVTRPTASPATDRQPLGDLQRQGAATRRTQGRLQAHAGGGAGRLQHAVERRIGVGDGLGQHVEIAHLVQCVGQPLQLGGDPLGLRIDQHRLEGGAGAAQAAKADAQIMHGLGRDLGVEGGAGRSDVGQRRLADGGEGRGRVHADPDHGALALAAVDQPEAPCALGLERQLDRPAALHQAATEGEQGGRRTAQQFEFDLTDRLAPIAALDPAEIEADFDLGIALCHHGLATVNLDGEERLQPRPIQHGCGGGLGENGEVDPRPSDGLLVLGAGEAARGRAFQRLDLGLAVVADAQSHARGGEAAVGRIEVGRDQGLALAPPRIGRREGGPDRLGALRRNREL